MGFAICYGNCIMCKKFFAFNPVSVPSVRLKSEREPICRECVESANVQRKEIGMAPIEILPDAYSACDESEL